MTKSLMRALVIGTIAFASSPRHARAAASCGSTVSLKYYGGPIIQNPKVIAVFWNDSVGTSVKTTMPLFYAAIVNSTFLDWLSEYNTVGLNGQDGQPGSNQGISRGSFAGSYTLTPSRCPGTATCTISDAQIQQELAAQFDAGNLPAPTLGCDGQNNSIYALHFPSTVTITYPPNEMSCQAFCGYHSGGTYNGKAFAYTVNADVSAGGCAGGCGNSPSPINNQTAVANQELFNAIADPSITTSITAVGRPLAWYANNCGEIGSICNGQQATITIGGTTWTVTKVWSNVARDCVTTRSPLPAICTGSGTPAGCRPCACADDGEGAVGQIGCSGATPRCDTTAADATYGQCVATTGTGGTGGAAGAGGAGGAGGRGGAAGGATGAGGTGGGSAGIGGAAGGTSGAGGSAAGTGGATGGAAAGAAGGTSGATGGSGGGGGAAGASGGAGGTGGKPEGTEGGACYGNGTCNMGLTCLSHVCVMAPKSSGGCGCAFGGSSDASALAIVALVLALVATRTRRRRLHH